MRESRFQANTLRKIKEMFPGCIVHKNDSSYTQGIPDFLVLFGFRWAMLEFKSSENADEQPNQRYYVDKCNSMGFAAFIYPENEEDVLRGLQLAFSDCW